MWKKNVRERFQEICRFFKHRHLFRALEIFFSVPVLPSFSGFRKIMLRFDLVTTKLFFNRKKNKQTKREKNVKVDGTGRYLRDFRRRRWARPWWRSGRRDASASGTGRCSGPSAAARGPTAGCWTSRRGAGPKTQSPSDLKSIDWSFNFCSLLAFSFFLFSLFF